MMAVVALIMASCLVKSCDAKIQEPQSELEAPLDSLFSTLFAPDEPGAIVLVAKGDTILYDRAFGLARLDVGSAITDSTLFNICSISKQFGAVALLKLQEEGMLDLDDSIKAYFPEFKADFYNNITFRQLLNHTSGIPDVRPRTKEQWKEYLKNNKSIYLDVEDYKRYALVKESTEYLKKLDHLNFEPGTQYEYENPTYQLIHPLVERVTGQNFLVWMQNNIFLRAGMPNTQYFSPDTPLYNYAHGYKPTEDGGWEEYDYGEADFFPTKADGGLYTSALEFMNWEHALLDGSIIGKKALRQAFTPYIDTEVPYTAYGLGFFLEDHPDRPKKIYHSGDNGGFLTYEAYYPKKKLMYLIFANRPDWPREQIVEQVDSILKAKGRI